MATTTLEGTARALVSPGKGILAADESHATIGRRFEPLGIANNEENRRRYRQMLLATKGIGEYISGVILFDETIRQAADDGRSFVKVLVDESIIPGIKVDRGTKPLAGSPRRPGDRGDSTDFASALPSTKQLGARFAKWRAVIAIGDDGRTPRRWASRQTLSALARYAALCQEAEIVPIVEPEVLIDGGHSIERCFEVTEATLHTVFHALWEHKVALGGNAPEAEHGVAGDVGSQGAGRGRGARQPYDVSAARSPPRCRDRVPLRAGSRTSSRPPTSTR